MTTDYVKESSFGVWFLGTRTWSTHVLTRAMNDLERLIGTRDVYKRQTLRMAIA